MKKIVVVLLILFIGCSITSGVIGNIPKRNIISEEDVIIETIKYNHFLRNTPEEEWNKTFGGANYDCGNYVYITSDGGYIITGRTESYGAGGSDVWLIKTNSNGIKEWDKTFGGSSSDFGWSVQQTNDEGYILTGGTSSYGDYSGDVWLIKTDVYGNKEWDNIFGGGNYDFAYSVQQTSDNGYIITGPTHSFGAGSSDAWLIKTISNGSKEWDVTFGGQHYDYSWSVKQTTDSGYIMTGRTESYGAGHGDVWLIKIDSNGSKEWDKTFGAWSFDSAESVQQTTDGGYIVAGFTNSYGAGWYDFWLIKTDSEGNKEWSKTFGGGSGDSCRSVQQTIDGGYILTGGTYSFGAGNSDVWVVKTDSNGNEEWNKTFGGSNYDSAESVQQTTDGGYIITGRTESFGAGGSDVWLIRIETENNPPYEPSEPIPENNSVDVEIETNISWTGGDPDNDTVKYDVYFGSTNPPPKIISNQTANTYEPSFINYNTTYYWQIVSWDNYVAYSKGPLWKFTVEVNQPPEPPIINGLTNGKARTQYSYEFLSLDPEGHKIFYEINWGDEKIEPWDGPYESNMTIIKNHTWSKQGDYMITARAKDALGAVGKWSDPFPITMPKSKTFIFIFNLFEWLFERFPNSFPILRQFLGR